MNDDLLVWSQLSDVKNAKMAVHHTPWTARNSYEESADGFVGDHLGFWALGDNFLECVIITVAMVTPLSDFPVLWDTLYDSVCFPVILEE
jgi:hypothetical protein